MKKHILLIFMLLSCYLSSAQEQQQHTFLLETDSSWTREVFPFPLSFAPQIGYEGSEETVFPKGWGKRDDDFFWSYAFVWHINAGAELGEKELEHHLQTYFDGLMQHAGHATKAYILKKDGMKYSGKVEVHDAFFSKQRMKLNVQVEQYYCTEQKKMIVLFRFSPQEFGGVVWSELRKVKLRSTECLRL